MKTLRSWLATILRTLCAVSLCVLLIIVLLGVLSKNVESMKMSWTSEAAELLLSWTVMLGAALAYLENAHLGVDLFTSKLDSGARRIAEAFTALIVFAFAAGVMVCGGWQLFSQRYDLGQTMASLPLLRAWFYFSLPVSGGLIAVFAAGDFIAALKGKAGDAKAASRQDIP